MVPSPNSEIGFKRLRPVIGQINKYLAPIGQFRVTSQLVNNCIKYLSFYKFIAPVICLN